MLLVEFYSPVFYVNVVLISFHLENSLPLSLLILVKRPWGVTESDTSFFSKIVLSVLWHVFKMITALDFRSTRVITAFLCFVP